MPLILIGHSLGGLLIKQALVNAHDNAHYSSIKTWVYVPCMSCPDSQVLIPTRSTGLMFFATPHEGGNTESKKVKLGLAAAKIARSAGFDTNDSLVQAVTKGSLFEDILKESFRHQLEEYNLVSFWGKRDNVGAWRHPRVDTDTPN